MRHVRATCHPDAEAATREISGVTAAYHAKSRRYGDLAHVNAVIRLDEGGEQ